MVWKNVQVPSGSKLFLQHNFIYMHKGVNYALEIDEFHNGTFTGHGENSTDKNFVIESVHGKSIDECVSGLISKISERG